MEAERVCWRGIGGGVAGRWYSLRYVHRLGNSTQVEEEHLIASLPRYSFATERLLTAGRFTVNVLADSQKELAVKFGSAERPGYKFEGVDYAIEGEAVVIEGCQKAIFCELESTKEIKKQLVVVGLVKHLASSSNGTPPLIYKKSDYFSD